MMDECTGCIFEHSTDITEHMKYCLHCKRGYFAEEERSIHDDLFSAKKGEENMNVKDLQEKLYELYQMRKNGIISEEEYATRIETIKAGLEKERAKQTTYFFRCNH